MTAISLDPQTAPGLITCCTTSSVHTAPQQDASVRQMSHPELGDLVEKVQGHVGNLSDVTVTVESWQPTDHHVGVTNRLHL